MPLYDRICPNCNWRKDDCYEPREFQYLCPQCESETVRAWAAPAMHTDDPFIGGKTIENMGHTPVTVYSRQEFKRAMRERGVEQRVQHVGSQGSDRNPNTQRWI